jgi:hypothetical protein
MKVFDHPDMLNFKCPICGKSDDKPIVLIGKQETADENIMEADQFHLECLDLISVQLPYNRIIVGNSYKR